MRQPGALVTFLALVAVATACGSGSAGDRAAPPTRAGVGVFATSSTTSTTEPAASTTEAPTTTAAVAAWVVGGVPLPRRPDGFGVVTPTPAPLVRRTLQAADRLPPPADGRFHSTIAATSAEQLGGTWKKGCPVPIVDLRHLTVGFFGFDGRPHTGELVVHRREAEDVIGVFAKLFAARFPIEEMRLITQRDLDAPPTGDGNNTAGFVCRPARGSTKPSAHASGLAIDLNPFQNPYVKGDLVLPELASAYLERKAVRPGMVRDGDVAVKAFAAIDWKWGGRWTDPTDTMHFTSTGT